MNFYHVTIGQTTRKGHFNELFTKVIQCESQMYMVRKFLEEKYAPLSVRVCAVEELLILDSVEKQEDGTNRVEREFDHYYKEEVCASKENGFEDEAKMIDQINELEGKLITAFKKKFEQKNPILKLRNARRYGTRFEVDFNFNLTKS